MVPRDNPVSGGYTWDDFEFKRQHIEPYRAPFSDFNIILQEIVQDFFQFKIPKRVMLKPQHKFDKRVFGKFKCKKEYYRAHPNGFKDYVKNDIKIGHHVLELQTSKTIGFKKQDRNAPINFDYFYFKFDFTKY